MILALLLLLSPASATAPTAADAMATAKAAQAKAEEARAIAADAALKGEQALVSAKTAQDGVKSANDTAGAATADVGAAMTVAIVACGLALLGLAGAVAGGVAVWRLRDVIQALDKKARAEIDPAQAKRATAMNTNADHSVQAPLNRPQDPPPSAARSEVPLATEEANEEKRRGMSTSSASRAGGDVQRAARPDPAGLGRARSATEDVATPVQAPAGRVTRELTDTERWLRKVGAGPYGGMITAIGELYMASPEMSRALRQRANQDEYMRLVCTELTPRLERFERLQRAAAAVFHSDWVEPDLIPILDGLSSLYCRALAESRGGNPAAALLADQLHEVLYQRVGSGCEEAGWFTLQVIVPFDTDFDPIRHTAIGTAEAGDASQKVVDIKQAGRLDVATGAVIAAAHVVVGR